MGFLKWPGITEDIHSAILYCLGTSNFSISAAFLSALYSSVVAASFSKSNSNLQSGEVESHFARLLQSSALRASALRTTMACSGANMDTEPHDSITMSATEAMFVSVAYRICLARGSFFRSPKESDRNFSIRWSLRNWSSPMSATIMELYYLKSMISNLLTPFGVVTSMVSPRFLPMRAAPMGLLKLILPFRASTLSGETSW